MYIEHQILIIHIIGTKNPYLCVANKHTKFIYVFSKRVTGPFQLIFVIYFFVCVHLFYSICDNV